MAQRNYRHGIPEELLSDRGLSNLIQEICESTGTSTSGYHPQTDDVGEKFNSTLANMIAKSCDICDRDWNKDLPYCLPIV